MQANGDMRAPIFYDSNDTTYYTNPAGTSQFNDSIFGTTGLASNTGIQIRYQNYSSGYGRIRFYQSDSNHQTIHAFSANWQSGNLLGSSTGGINIEGQNGVTFGPWNAIHTGITSAGVYIRNNGNLYLDYNYGQSVVGVYSDVRYQGIFAMGDAYKLSIDGTGTGNLYGLAWSHPNRGGVASNLADHGLLLLQYGTFRTAIGGGRIVTTSDIRGTVFYDYDDTGYYTDPNTTGTAGRFRGQLLIGPNSSGRYTRIGGNGGAIDEATLSASNGNLHIDSANGYGLYLNHYSNGTIFMNNGGGHAFSYTSLRAPIFYDYNNTNYYLDPDGTSVLLATYIGGHYYYTYNSANIMIRTAGNSDGGILLQNAGGSFKFQLYADNSSNYGFLNGPWASWDLRKTLNGNLFMNNNSSYYLNTNSISQLAILRTDVSTSGYTAMFGPYTLSTNGQTFIYPDDARYGVVVNAPYYPHLYINSYANGGNPTHGGVFSMSGFLTGGGFRRFVMGIANTNPNEMSFGWYDNNYNPHYGVGINWSYPASIWYDTSNNFYVRNSVYAYTFYDRDNTGYYANPASTSNFNYVIAANGASYQHNAYNNNGSFMMNNASTYWGMMLNVSANDWRLGYGGGNSIVGWNLRWDNGSTVWANGSFRAPIFYDSDDTGYYANPNGESSFSTGIFYGNRLVIRGGSPTLYFRDTDENSAMLHNNSNRLYVLRGGTDSESWGTVNGYWPTYWQLNTNYCLMGGTTEAVYDFRAPIFYDSNNTAYYCDPNGTARLSYVAANGGIRIDGNADLYLDNNYGQSVVGVYTSVRYQGVFSMGNSYKPAIDGTSMNNLYGIAWSHPNVGGQGGYLNDHGMIVANYGTAFAAISSRGWFRTSVQSPIFYDDNNTGYYCNPNAYSQFSSGEANDYWRVSRLTFTGEGGNSGNGAHAYAIFQEGGGWGYPYPDLRIAFHTGIKLGANASYEGTRIYDDYPMGTIRWQFNGGSGYNYQYTWTQLTGHHGHYSGTNGAHWYPNDVTYGAWRMAGNRNGWYGHRIDSSYAPHIMFESGNGGIYYQDNGRWVFYHSLGNNCTGLGTSSTASGYGIYVNGGVYATGNVVAYSDARKKKDVVTVDKALDKVLQLRGVYYTKIYNENDTIPDGGADKRQLGVIAQEVNEVVPEVVSYVKDLDEYAVAYGNMSALLIEAIKEQNQIIKKQADEIEEMKEILNKLIFNNKG
jgi:hypothetical protein